MKNLDKYLSLLGEEVDGLLLTSRFSRYYGAEYSISEGVAVVSAKGEIEKLREQVQNVE